MNRLKIGPRTGVLLFMAALLMGEVSLRLGGYPRQVAILARPGTGWMPIPNQRIRMPGGEVAINSMGFRDREWGQASGAPLRIAILGDSVTFGTGIEVESRFSEVLQAHLRSSTDAADCEVRNFAVPGFTASQMEVCYDQFVLPWKPDVLVIALNDGSGLPPLPVVEGDWLRPLLVRSALLARLTAWGQLKTKSTRLGTDSRSRAIRRLRSIGRAAPFDERLGEQWQALRTRLLTLQQKQASHGGKLLVLGLPRRFHMQNPGAQHVGRFLGDWLAENQITTSMPMEDFQAAKQATLLFLQDDPIHWTAAAHALAAESLQAAIKQLHLY